MKSVPSWIISLILFLFTSSFAQDAVKSTPCPSTVKYEGKTYTTVQIETQCWFKENLDVGTMITGTATQTDNSRIEKYCYNDDPANCNTFGGLYRWSETMQYSNSDGAKGICPTGWHIPRKAELQILVTNTGKNSNTLKAVGQGKRTGAGTNTSGFSALLTGSRDKGGEFTGLGYDIMYWSSTESETESAYFLYIGGIASYVNFGSDTKENCSSVRCLKD